MSNAQLNPINCLGYLDISQGGQPLGVPDGVLAARKRAGLATDLIPVGGPRKQDDPTGGSLR